MEITVISGWGSTEPDHVAMREIYKEFEDSHHGVTVNLVSMPSSDDVITKVHDLLTVGEIPDVIFTGGLGEESIYDFMIKKGYAVNLTPYMEEDSSFSGNIAPATKKRWEKEGGELYTVSDVLLYSGYWYNRTIFERAGIGSVPKTWDDFARACEKIKEYAKDQDTEITMMQIDEDHAMYLTDAILAGIDEKQLLGLQNGKANIRSGPFDQTADLIGRICEYSQYKTQNSYRDTLLAFNSGSSAIYINGIWASTMISEDLDAEYAPFPSPDGQEIACESSCLGYILGNTGDQERIDASVEFLKYMLSVPVQRRIMDETGQIPSNPKVNAVDITENERLKQALLVVDGADEKIEIPVNIWKQDERKRWIAYLDQRLG